MLKMTDQGGNKLAKLELFASPLLPKTKEEASESHGDDIQLQNGFGTKSHRSENSSSYTRMHQAGGEGLPAFQRHEEATNIELFYDLFFVANLTTFSTIHEINSTSTLKSYVGFFCVLWFTWCQVSLYDVRFVADSVLERAAKACHLGIMVGFAVVGPNFTPQAYVKSVFQTMSLILMCSRFILSFQYLLVMFHVRRYPSCRAPFILIAAINFVAAIIYLGVTFVFTDTGHHEGYAAFYVVAIAEISGNIAVSSLWKVLSFKGTHLIQRMSLLTLIILGEGVIVVCRNISRIVQNEHAWTADTIGIIIAAISIIYLLYMLYFDSLTREHFGSIRQPVWTFLHFPFHLALVLFMEGTAQFVLWHKMVEAAFTFLNAVQNITQNSTETSAQSFLDFEASLNATVKSIFTDYPPTDPATFGEVHDILQTIGAGFTKNNTASINAYDEAGQNLVFTVTHSIFKTYGFEAAESGGSATPTEELDADFQTINLVFIYFFIAAGITLLLMGVLNLITIRSGFSRTVVIRASSYFFFGLGLCLLSTMAGHTAEDNLDSGPWILPIVTLSIALVLVINHIRWPSRVRKH